MKVVVYRSCEHKIYGSRGGTMAGQELSLYLQEIIHNCCNLDFKGINQQPHSLKLPRIPLDEIFIHLRVISDRPLYDVPMVQQKQLEEIRQHSHLSEEERE